MTNSATVIEHPLVQHKLSHLRARDTRPAEFRRLLREIGQLMAYDVLRDLPLTMTAIETPLTVMQAPVLEGKKLVLASILRAGNGLLDGLLDIVPQARVGHIGLYRDPKSLEAVEYYLKLPPDVPARRIIVVDPMLATANTATAAIGKLKEAGAVNMTFVCVLAAPEGIAALSDAHPDVPIFTAAIDDHLDDHGYIVPGLGDAGDRIYGT